MTASKTKATKAKASAAKASVKATAAPMEPTAVPSDLLEPVQPAEIQSQPTPVGREPKHINSTQAAALLASGVVVGRAIGWL